MRDMKKHYVLLALICCFVFPVQKAITRSARLSPYFATGSGQQFADLGDFKLQSGRTIHGLRLGYRTLGKLNEKKTNAILWPTWLGGQSSDLLPYAGPNSVLDTNRYFVIFVDAIGNGVSTSPSNSKSEPRLEFPQFTIRDMVESEHELVTTVFQLTQLYAVMGVSMGGMQTFEWAVAYRNFAGAAIPMTGSPQSTAYDKLLWTAESNALELDPEWKNGAGTKPMTAGFGLFSEIDSMNLSSPAYRVSKTKPEDFASFLAATNKSEIRDAGIACDAIRQRQAIMALDMPREYGASMAEIAKRVRAKMLVVVSPEDHMVNPAPAMEFAAAAGAPVIRLDSACGHLSLDCISAGPVVAQFLASPASVQSMTLTENHSQ
jgi:homoserine O-acetyltransferase